MSTARRTDAQLRAIARRSYGVSCDQIFCRGRDEDRLIHLPDDLQADRDEALGGTWVTARLWIPDDGGST